MPPTPGTCEDSSNEEKRNANDEDNNLENPVPTQIFASSSGTDDEDNDANYGGYELLPQNPGEFACQEQDDEEADQLQLEAQSDLNKRETEDRIALWQSTPAYQKSIHIDEEKADKIKTAMMGFTLPTTSVPAWATAVPEEKWMAKLAEKIKTEADCDVINSLRSINAQH